MKWKPADVIACIIVIGCIVLKSVGQDDALNWALIGIIAAYYGIDLTPLIKLGRKQKPKEGD